MGGNDTEELRRVFEQLPGRFRKGALGRDLSYYFSFGDAPGEKWTVVVGPERCEVKEGRHVEKADCVLKTTPDFFLRMVREGYEPGFLDFARGKIKSNDPILLRDLKSAFGL